MPDIFATLIVTAANVAQASTIAATFTGGDGMFTSELSATGNAPATHFISSGTMPKEIVDAVADLAEVSDLLPLEALQASGLTLCVPSA